MVFITFELHFVFLFVCERVLLDAFSYLQMKRKKNHKNNSHNLSYLIFFYTKLIFSSFNQIQSFTHFYLVTLILKLSMYNESSLKFEINFNLMKSLFKKPCRTHSHAHEKIFPLSSLAHTKTQKKNLTIYSNSSFTVRLMVDIMKINWESEWERLFYDV